jgi:mono/diheme cytochrome c family protein
VTAYNDTTVAASATYYYRAQAYNAAGNSAYSTVGPVTTPAPALDGAAIFAASCTSCHGIATARASSRTQSQLITWIPGHMTGSSLSPAQVEAVAAYIKP